jgi:sugar lactone lactonase YvrE
VSGGTYSIGGGAFTSTTGTVTNGQVVTVKVKSSDKTNTPVTATLTAGGVSGQFTVTTKLDIDPDELKFTPVTNAGAKAVTASNEITVTGIDTSAPISITSGEYSINGAAFTNVAGTVNRDQKVIVRATSSDKPSTDVTAALTIGGVTGNFVVTTKADEAAPTAQILFPPPVSMTEGNTILVRGSAIDEFSTIKSVKVNGVLATTTDGFKNWQASVPLLDSSETITSTTENTIVVATEDDGGNKSTDAAHVAIRQAQLNITSFPDSDNGFRYVFGMVVDKANGKNRLLVNDQDYKIKSVDLNTSKRTIFFSDFDACNFTAISLNSPAGRVYASCYENKIYDFDLLDSSKYEVHESPLYENVTSMLWSPITNKLVTVSFETGAVIMADQTLSNQSVLSDARKSVPNTLNPINQSFAGIVYDKSRNRYLVSDFSQQAIFAVDPTSGERTLFSSNSVGNGPKFGEVGVGYLSGLAIDDENDRLLASDALSGNLFWIDLSTGDRTLLSAGDSTNRFNKLNESYFVTIFDSNSYAFVSDYSIWGIYAVDLVTGHRVVFTKS